MNNKRTTVVLGASTNSTRYSYLAINRLIQHHFPVIAIGNKKGFVNGKEIEPYFSKQKDIHTITIYINAHHQKNYYDYIFSLNPKRIIFNPGAENDELFELAKLKGIEVIRSMYIGDVEYGSVFLN